MIQHISIHALLAESDLQRQILLPSVLHFYPRSPCGERPRAGLWVLLTQIFLSTLSLRRATGTLRTVSVRKTFLSTLSLRRATFKMPVPTCIYSNFYPRSPCGERLVKNHVFIVHNLFLSTLSLRRATCSSFVGTSSKVFLSTLSLRRATSRRSDHLLPTKNFYPRSPCGERLLAVQLGCRSSLFLSTLSLRRATQDKFSIPSDNNISIHALLAESDACILTISICTVLFLSTLSLRRATLYGCYSLRHSAYFYPRSPCGERRVTSSTVIVILRISIHALLAESDTGERASIKPIFRISIHALLAESDRLTSWAEAITANFYPRSPCGERRASPKP